jgi:hypothetical protein
MRLSASSEVAMLTMPLRSLNSFSIFANGSITDFRSLSCRMTLLELASSFQKSDFAISASRLLTFSAFRAMSKITSQVLEFLLDHPQIFFKLFYHSPPIISTVRGARQYLIPGPSRLSIRLFASAPRAKPPIEPSERTTLWQGTAGAYGFLLSALPTARHARGRPILAATHA